MNILGFVLLLVGSLVLLLASVGLFVLRDALSRQHASTKAGSLGIVLIVAGTALAGGIGPGIGVRWLLYCWSG